MRDDCQFGPAAEAVGADDLDDLGRRGLGDVDGAVLPVPAHGGGLSGSRGSIVDRGVGGVHAGELANHGLVLKNGLQKSLADFRLVGRVGGDKFFFGDHGGHDGRDIVAVSSGSPENVGEDPVFPRQLLHMGHNLQFRAARRNV